MQREEVLKIVCGAINKGKEGMRIRTDMAARESERLYQDLGLDSLLIVMTIIEIEDQLKIEISDEAVEHWQTIGDIVDYLHPKLAEKEMDNAGLV